MGECVIVYGKSGTGKSRSLKNFGEDEILFINKDLSPREYEEHIKRLAKLFKI